MVAFFKKLFCKHSWKHSQSFYNGYERITISECKKCRKIINNL